MSDPYDLQRFLDAQAPVYGRVLLELRAGAKASHWMWFIFPQLKGLGRSAMAQHFGLASAAEADAYRRHPVLGARLLECVDAVLALQGRSAAQIFGSPDDVKFRSSMTLFAQVAGDDMRFEQALRRYCGGVEDPATLQLLDSLAGER